MAFTFGFPATPAAAAARPGAPATPAAPPLFGAPAATPAAPAAAPLFGTAAAAATQQPTLFGTYAPAAAPAAAAAANAATRPGERTPGDELRRIHLALQPATPQSRLRFMFYNTVAPERAALYARPAGTDEQLWAQAARDNPDPRRLVPVQATGFGDLRTRAAEQQKLSEAQAAQLRDAGAFLEAARRRHRALVDTRVPALRHAQLLLATRVLRALARLEVARLRGTPLGADEEGLFARFDKLCARLDSPTAVRGRVAELRTAARALEGRARPQAALLDTPQLASVALFLEQMQTGLDKLVETLKKDERAVNALVASRQSIF